MTKFWRSYNTITVCSIQIIWFITLGMWDNGSMSPLLILRKTGLLCFLLDNIYPIYINFPIEKLCLNIIKIILKIDKTFNDMGTDWSCEKNGFLNFLQHITYKQSLFVPLWIHYNTQPRTRIPVWKWARQIFPN